MYAAYCRHEAALPPGHSSTTTTTTTTTTTIIIYSKMKQVKARSSRGGLEKLINSEGNCHEA